MNQRAQELHLEQLVADEFSGGTAPDTAAARKREVVRRAVAAREIRDQAKEFVRVGERLCDQKAREIAQAHVEAAYQERQRVEGEITRNGRSGVPRRTFAL